MSKSKSVVVDSVKSVSKSSEMSKEALKHMFAQEAARKAGEDEEVVQVKQKLRALSGFEGMGENELSTRVERLINKDELRSEFSHLYDIYNVVDKVITEAAERPDEFQTSIELETTRKRAERRLEQVAKLPAYLYLTDLQSFGESGGLTRAAGTRLSATLTTLLDFEYGAHHAALMIGDVVLEWDDSSVVIPRQRDVAPVFRANLQRHHSHWLSRVSEAHMDMSTATSQDGGYGSQIKFMVELNAEKKNLLDNLIDVIIRYNKYHYYHVFSRNCQHFVLDAMKALGLVETPTFSGRMREYYESLRKGRRRSEFATHEDLDHHVMRNLRSLQPDDLEFFLCQYYGFHHREAQSLGQTSPGDFKCQVVSCQMGKLDERIQREVATPRLTEYSRKRS